MSAYYSGGDTGAYVFGTSNSNFRSFLYLPQKEKGYPFKGRIGILGWNKSRSKIVLQQNEYDNKGNNCLVTLDIDSTNVVHIANNCLGMDNYFDAKDIAGLYKDNLFFISADSILYEYNLKQKSKSFIGSKATSLLIINDYMLYNSDSSWYIKDLITKNNIYTVTGLTDDYRSLGADETKNLLYWTKNNIFTLYDLNKKKEIHNKKIKPDNYAYVVFPFILNISRVNTFKSLVFIDTSRNKSTYLQAAYKDILDSVMLRFGVTK